MIIPDHGYTRESRQYDDFVKYITELTGANRKVFISFITGSTNLPIDGFAALDPRITLVKRTASANPDSELPTVSTCQHYVKLPEYSSYEIMKERFDYASKEGSKNFHFN